MKLSKKTKLEKVVEKKKINEKRYNDRWRDIVYRIDKNIEIW